MDAVVTAGGINPPTSSLYQLTQVEKKALIPLLKRPMICWVLEALLKSGIVNNIVIVGLEPHELDFNNESLHFIDSEGGLIENNLAAYRKLKEINPNLGKFLLCSSDVPLITPESIRGFVEECGSQEADIYYAVVEEKTLELNFPNSKRTFVPFKGGRYSGGDLFLVDEQAPRKVNLDIMYALTSSRKNYWKQAQILGFGFILRFIFRRMTIHGAAQRAGELIHLDARVIDTQFAELAMDLDKAHQYELIKSHLEKQQSGKLLNQQA